MTAKEKAKDYVKAHTATAAGLVLATAAIPGGATTVLIVQEGIMCFQIAKIYGHSVSEKEATGIAASIGLASVTGQLIALEACIITGPFAFLIKPGIAAAIVRILGDQIIDYFEKMQVQAIPIIENTICLIGKTGSGKSSTGNALLGYYCFPVSAANGFTTQVKAANFIDGYRIKDTPGLLDQVYYDALVLSELSRARVVVYVSAEAPYGPELEFIARIKRFYLKAGQYFLFYLNNQDHRDRMPAADRQGVYEDAVARLQPYIPPQNIVIGASNPSAGGERLTPRIEDLRAKLNTIVHP